MFTPQSAGFVRRYESQTGANLSLSPPGSLTLLNVSLLQLVDFEAMTAPGSEAFSRIAKSWMNLKRSALDEGQQKDIATEREKRDRLFLWGLRKKLELYSLS